MTIIKWCLVVCFIANSCCEVNFKGFDDSILYKINWPGKNGLDFLVSTVNFFLRSGF